MSTHRFWRYYVAAREGAAWLAGLTGMAIALTSGHYAKATFYLALAILMRPTGLPDESGSGSSEGSSSMQSLTTAP